MIDISGLARREIRVASAKHTHPLIAGALAVTFIATSVMTARAFLNAGWGEWQGMWWLPGIALLISAGCVAGARAWPRQAVPVLVPQAWSEPEARGLRRHRRYVPANRVTVLHLQDGRRIGARIANISVAAVALEADISDIDYVSVVRVGSREVGPIRRTASGAVFAFRNILDPQPFDRSFVL